LIVTTTASQLRIHARNTRGLEAGLPRSTKGQGFEVLAFPANEFRPVRNRGRMAEIKNILQHEVITSKFPIFSKIVVKGDGIPPVYKFPHRAGGRNPQVRRPDFPGTSPSFLVNRKGEVIARFLPKDAPESAPAHQ